MAWFSPPDHRHQRRDISPKRYQPRAQSWRFRGPRRSRLVSWGLCFLVFLAIVFWPEKRIQGDSHTLRRPQNSKSATKTKPRPQEAHNEQPRLKKSRQRAAAEPAEHVYRADGLLDVNPKARHPIFELIERSDTQWKRKVDRQSKTFPQAVQEYKRRYGRAPPKGFEIWWDYADFHQVRLIDEYDSIHTRLQPFWGVSPQALRAQQSEWEARDGTFTIGKVDGAPLALLNDTMRGSRLGSRRAEEQLELLDDVEEWLPDFRATFTMHDGPAQFTSWEMRKRAEDAAAKGEYIDVKSVARSILDTGWAAGCPPNSPIHTYSPTSPTSTSTSSPMRKSFIYNHRLAMDPCLHPSHLTLNGYLSQYPHPNPHSALVPTFSICATALHSDLLASAPEQWEDELVDDPPWDDKSDERLLWRGSNTGILHQNGHDWNVSHRIRLVEMATRRGGTVRVLTPRGAGSDVEGVQGAVGYGEEVRTSLLNPAYMDVAFVGQPIQCKAPVCETLKSMFEWRARQSWSDAWQYRYIIDTDGNGWSARFKRLMTSNSLIFKTTIFPEWYTERIMPWVHYIPIQVDLSDLYDTLAFFRGDLSGSGAHDDLAQRIASAGRDWSDTYWRREDMTAYHFRLFLEYARVMSEDREAISYQEAEIDVDLF